MSRTLASGIEIGLTQIAKLHLHPEKYKDLQKLIRNTKLVHVGNGRETMHDLILDHAARIADWATNNRFSEASAQVEEQKRKVIDSLKQFLHHL